MLKEQKWQIKENKYIPFFGEITKNGPHDAFFDGKVSQFIKKLDFLNFSKKRIRTILKYNLWQLATADSIQPFELYIL